MAMFLACFAVAVPSLLFLSVPLEHLGLTRTKGIHAFPLIPVSRTLLPALIEIFFIFSSAFILSLFLPVEKYWFLYAIIALWAALRFGIKLTALTNLWNVFLALILPAIISGLYGASWFQESSPVSIYIGLGVLCITSLVTGSTITTLLNELSTRKQVEEEINEGRHFLDKILNTSPNLIYIYDLVEQRNVYANQEMFEFLGYKPEMINSNELSIISDIIYPDDLEKIMEHYERFAAVGDNDILEIEYRLKDASGCWHWIKSRDIIFSRDSSGKAWQIIGSAEDITGQKLAEEQLRNTLVEKETLLRELYHRTKNNMNVICALLDLQSLSIKDAVLQEAFKETKNRINSMALVHKKLYQAQDLSRLNLKEYVNDLVKLLAISYNISTEKISLVLDLQDVLVLIDTAIPCGLILNELISNAFKYAFPDDREGEIRIKLVQTADGDIQLEVADNGVGVRKTFDFRKDGRLGLQNIFVIGENQLKGKVMFNANRGLICRIQFRDDLYYPRV